MYFTIKKIMYNEETICCWLFAPNTPLQNERLCDDNDNDILFKNNNPNGEQVISCECIAVSSDSYYLGNNYRLVRKLNNDKKIAMVLTYKDETNKRVLINGFLLVDGKKYNITDFTFHNELEVNGKTYTYIHTCNYDA